MADMMESRELHQMKARYHGIFEMVILNYVQSKNKNPPQH